jgi:hypothetical protein
LLQSIGNLPVTLQTWLQMIDKFKHSSLFPSPIIKGEEKSFTALTPVLKSGTIAFNFLKLAAKLATYFAISNVLKMTSYSSTRVEHSPHHLEVEGLSPDTVAGIGSERKCKIKTNDLTQSKYRPHCFLNVSSMPK